MKKEVKKKIAKPVDAIKRFGYFNDKTSEFVITTPHTPSPWENRIWNDQMDIRISNHGDGRDAHRSVYIYDRKEKVLWCPNWFPVNTKLDTYEVRHGLKYTIFKASKNGIEVTWVVTLHHSDTAEIWRVEVKNAGRKEQDLLVVPFYQSDAGLTCSESVNRFGSFFSKKANCLCISMKKNDSLCFHSDRKFSKFEMNKSCFLKGYTSLAAPETVLKDEWANSFIDGNHASCLAAGFDIKLKKDQAYQINMEIFKAENIESAEKLSAAYLEEKVFEISMKKHADDASIFYALNSVKTMNPIFDRYVNVWIPHQLRCDVQSSKDAKSFSERMFDCDISRIFEPSVIRPHIIKAAESVTPDGQTDQDIEGCVWFQNAVCQYIRETGEMSILDEKVSYFGSDEVDTLLGHLKRTIEFLEKQRETGKICRINFGNGKEESVSMTMAYVWGLKNSSALLKMLRDPDAEIYSQRAKELSDLLNSNFFEEDRYLQAVIDTGFHVGSKQNEEGKIWIGPQSWSMLSCVADYEKATKIVETMKKELYTPFGVMSLSPVYTKYSADAGSISDNAPGIAGNGSVDLLEMFFYTYGLTQADMSNEAFDLLNRVFFTNPKNPPEKSKTEPFRIAGSFHGPASRYAGCTFDMEKNGSAGWFLKTVWDGMIGICPDFDCVKVNARLPKAFGDRIEVNRIVRGRSIRFEIAKTGFESKDAAFTMRVKNGADISYKDISDNEYILIVI